MTDGISDQELLNRVRARDKQALAALYDRYQRPVFSLAAYMLNSGGGAEEVLQDIFLYVWERPDAWNPAQGRFQTWLLAITRYRAIDRLRSRETTQQRREIPFENADEFSRLAADDDTGYEDGRVLRGLVERLPREQADMIEMAFFKGMTHSSIASATGIPLGTVKSRLRAGLQTLRALWLREMEIGG